jgi:hypothetical protein
MVLIILWFSYQRFSEQTQFRKYLIKGTEYLRAVCDQPKNNEWPLADKELYDLCCVQLGRYYQQGLMDEKNNWIIPIDFKKAEFFFIKSNLPQAKMELCHSLLMSQKDFRKAYLLLKEVLAANVSPYNLQAYMLIETIDFTSKIGEMADTEISSYIENFFDKVLNPDQHFDDEDTYKNIIRSHAIEHYLMLYFQEHDPVKRQKYADSANRHFNLIERNYNRQQLHKNILASLDSKENKIYFDRKHHESKPVKRQNIMDLLRQHQAALEKLNSSTWGAKDIVKWEDFFQKIAEGLNKIDSYEDLKQFLQYPMWQPLLNCLKAVLMLSLSPAIKTIALKVISKLQLYVGDHNPSVSDILLTTMPVETGIDSEQLSQRIYWLAQIGPVFSNIEFQRLLTRMIAHAVDYAKQQSRDESPKKSCLLLYSLSLLHVAFSGREKKYQPILLMLARSAQQVVVFSINQKPELNQFDLHQVKMAAFYFLRCSIPEEKSVVRPIRNTFFSLLQNLGQLTKQDDDLFDKQKVTTSHSQHRIYREIQKYFSEAQEEQKIELKAAGQTITHRLDIFIPKIPDDWFISQIKAKRIEVDGALHKQYSLEEKTEDGIPKMYDTPKTRMRNVLRELYNLGSLAVISSIDPALPNLQELETFETRKQWFQFLILQIGCPPILFFINLPPKYQTTEPWRLNGKKAHLEEKNQLVAYLSYQDLYQAGNLQLFSRLIKEQSKEYGFTDAAALNRSRRSGVSH